MLGATHRPTSFGQFWHWIAIILPNRKQFHMIGLTAICWAIWTARNNSCFEKKSQSDLLQKLFAQLAPF